MQPFHINNRSLLDELYGDPQYPIPPLPFNIYEQHNPTYPAEYLDQAWLHNGVHQDGHWESVPTAPRNTFHASHSRFPSPASATLASMPSAPLSHTFDASPPDMTRRVHASTPTAATHSKSAVTAATTAPSTSAFAETAPATITNNHHSFDASMSKGLHKPTKPAKRMNGKQALGADSELGVAVKPESKSKAVPTTTAPTKRQREQSERERAVKKHKASKPTASDSGSESDTPIPRKNDNKQWSQPETMKLLMALLSPDSKYYQLFHSNATRAFKKIARSVFNHTRAPHSIKNRYARLFKTYKAIVKLEAWTGNGANDPDDSRRIAAARNASVDLGQDFTAKVMQDFKSNGYYEIFNDRIGEDPTITRAVDHHSGAISDLEDYLEVSDDDDMPSVINITASSDESDMDDKENKPPSGFPKMRTPARKQSAAPSAMSVKSGKTIKKQHMPGVPVAPFKPRVKPTSSFGGETGISDYLASTSAYLKSSMEEGKERMQLLKERSERDKEREEREEKTRNADQMKAIIADPNMPDDTKQIAKEALNAYLRSLF